MIKINVREPQKQGWSNAPGIEVLIDFKPEYKDWEYKKVPGGTYGWREDKTGLLVSFLYGPDKDQGVKHEHWHGALSTPDLANCWSSNSDAVNKVFAGEKSEVVEVSYQTEGDSIFFAGAASVNRVRKLIPEGWELVKVQTYFGTYWKPLKAGRLIHKVMQGGYSKPEKQCQFGFNECPAEHYEDFSESHYVAKNTEYTTNDASSEQAAVIGM